MSKNPDFPLSDVIKERFVDALKLTKGEAHAAALLVHAQAVSGEFSNHWTELLGHELALAIKASITPALESISLMLNGD